MREAEHMNESRHSLALWNASDTVVIPTSTSTPAAIVEFAKPQLSNRDIKSIIAAFESESFEMVATFVWTKAAAALKKQLATLGMEFVGEMLARPDLDDDSDPSTCLADHEAVALAEDLGMITTTQGLRLKHALELVNHFANLDQHQADAEGMSPDEAVSLLRNCITSILGKPSFEAAMKFAEFRKALGERTLRADDVDVQALLDSPYFFTRTTLAVLLAATKGAKGALQEHAVGNLSVLVPLLWPKMREPERWQVGQSYAEVNAAGNRLAAAGLKKTLVQVHGFDFVPESLRSHTFTVVAARVLAAHFEHNNFYKEEAPMSDLASLGTAIPKPAFAKCMEATLAVRVGNYWGDSFAAQKPAKEVLDSLRNEQWEYYLNECLRRDRTLLDKLCGDGKPMQRWIDLVQEYNLGDCTISEKPVKDLVQACARSKRGVAREKAVTIRNDVTN